MMLPWTSTTLVIVASIGRTTRTRSSWCAGSAGTASRSRRSVWKRSRAGRTTGARPAGGRSSSGGPMPSRSVRSKDPPPSSPAP